MEARELLLVDELLFKGLVGRFVHRVVVGASFLGERAPHLEDLQHLVDLRVVELGSPVRMEHLYVRDGEIKRREGGFDQPRVFSLPCRMPDYLAVVQVDEQADVVPPAAHAHVREVGADMGAGRVTVEVPGHDIGQVAAVRRGLSGLHLGVPPDAGQVVLLQDAGDSPARGAFAAAGENGLYAARAVAASVLLEDGDDFLLERVRDLFPFVGQGIVIGCPRNA